MKDQNKLAFWEHLEELRWCLFKSIFAIFFFSIISFIYSDNIMNFLISPTNNLNVKLNLQVLKVTSIFNIKLGISLMGGLILSIPVIIYQFWKFVSPALENNYTYEIIFIVLFSTFFFLRWIIFCVFLINTFYTIIFYIYDF